MATGPLDGIRVLDFTTTIAGPYCTRLMADLGAEVIKIETAEGDMMRTRPPLRDGASTSFGQLNAGKQSIVLDLKRPEAREVVRRLLTTHDFLVENFRPGGATGNCAACTSPTMRDSMVSSIDTSMCWPRPVRWRCARAAIAAPNA